LSDNHQISFITNKQKYTSSLHCQTGRSLHRRYTHEQRDKRLVA